MSFEPAQPDANSAPANSIIVWVDGQAFYGVDGHTIGRDEAASVTVHHAQVSRTHARIEFDGSGWMIRDLGSLNGLFDEQGKREVIALPAGRTRLWLGPPSSSPCLYFDVTPGFGQL